jgi:O-glycosyl hydrolase
MKQDTVFQTMSTGDGSAMLKKLDAVPMTKAPAKSSHPERTLVVDPSVTDQPMLGMGGIWTDTDVYNLLRMEKKEQDKVLAALFHPTEGAGWNFMRIPFGSTDWESVADYYTYDDMPRGERDTELKSFSIKRDIDRGLFALIRRCKEINPELLFLGSVWGVPAWMKENDSIMYGRFNPEFTDVYARYLRMTVQAYGEQGVELHAVTPQNESLTSDDRATPACRFTWRMQKDVIIALRREFKEHNLDTQIWVYDHNFNMARNFVEPLLADKEALAALDGVAFHDYGGSPKEMGRLKQMHPSVPFYMTERLITTVADMDNYVQELRNGARSYLQWTTMSDEYGGPHQFIGRPFIYGKPLDKSRLPFIYNMLDDPDDWRKAPSYGLYAQFTKFLKRGMLRAGCTGGHKQWITAAAFCEDGRIAVVAVNQTEEAQDFTLRIGGAQAKISQAAQSVATYEIAPGALCGGATCPVSAFGEPAFTESAAFDIEPVIIITNGLLREGNEIAFSCRVKNSGTAPTPPRATLKVQFSLDGDFDIARSTTCIPSLAPGEEVTVDCNVPYGKKTTWTAEAGWHTIFAQAELGNCFAEENIDNNRMGIEIFIE